MAKYQSWFYTAALTATGEVVVLYLRTFSIGVACGMTGLFASVLLPIGAAHAAHPTASGYGLQERRPLFRPPSRGSSSTRPTTRWRPHARVPSLRTPTRPEERPFTLIPVDSSPYGQAPNRRPHAIRAAGVTYPPPNHDHRFRPTHRAARYDSPGTQVPGRQRAQRPPRLAFGSPQFRPAQTRAVKVYEQMPAADPAHRARAAYHMPRYALPPFELPLEHRSYRSNW